MTKPIDKIEQFPVEASFFENQGENGPWINATISKVYKQGDEWKRTNNFNGNDLLKLNALMPRIMERQHELEHGQPCDQTQSNGQDMEAIKQEAQEHLDKQSQGQTQDHEGQTP
ncbi:hypothetical protein VWY06_01970 [Phaeobacter sp. JH20_10]|uniref:hypothetical protein n=1 Tax=Phaeobacter sp. JH20_10 TaxID=3112469 RepID=UPI003A852FD4